MRPETREAMEMLFAAKWNVPKAAKHCNLSMKEMKITFNEYCNFHEPTYNNFDNAIQLTIDYEQEVPKNST